MPKITITKRRVADALPAVAVIAAATLAAGVGARSAPAPAAPVAGGSPAARTACTRAVARKRSAALALFRARMAPRRRAYFRTHRQPAQRRAFVRRQEATLRTLRRAVAACATRPAPPRPPGPPQPIPFHPQAGLLWQDLYTTNYLDLDPGPGAGRARGG